MTQDEMIELAKQSGIHTDWEISAYKNELQHFAKLVADKEREACADLCEQYGFNNHCGITTDVIAIEIRARGQA